MEIILMSITVRPATEADYEDICRLFREADVLHSHALPHVFQLSEEPARPKEFMHGILADNNAALLVAEDGGKIAGFISVAVRESAPAPMMVPRRYGYIEDIAVFSNSRRHGVGRALMTAAERWGKKMGVTGFELTVWDFNNKAKAFFTEMGYSMASHRMWKLTGDTGEKKTSSTGI
jgi:ribosomal protein S18 acetylase RimI-like enzyme